MKNRVMRLRGHFAGNSRARNATVRRASANFKTVVALHAFHINSSLIPTIIARESGSLVEAWLKMHLFAKEQYVRIEKAEQPIIEICDSQRKQQGP
mmetsp:Transcript_23906/g.49371  ORF Transcript_23906/g.49371 Transcript_23906/m.49371 type:complete len:96 (-) Transcript_23906:200-487(-)